MPTENWYPITGAPHTFPHNGWVLAAGTNKNSACRPGGGRTPGAETHDDATSYINSGVAQQNLNIDWPGNGLIAALTGILTANFRHRSFFGLSNRQMRMQNVAGLAGGSIFNVTDGSTSWTTSGPQDISSGATYRPGGTPWVPADFNDDATICVWHYNSAAGTNAAITSTWGTLGYGGAPGAFMWHIIGITALVLSTHFLFRADLDALLADRRANHPRHTVLTPAETDQLWRELREYRHPRHFL